MIERSANCPICSTLSLPGRFTVRDVSRYICPNCRCEFLWPDPHAQAGANFYDARYLNRWGLDKLEDAVRAMKIRTFNGLLDHLELHTTGRRVLDVGCATGYFLEAAAARGWDVFGTDVNPFAAQMARACFGDRVMEGPLETVPAEYSFDVVVATDVIEHVARPLEFLVEARQRLTRGGLLAVTTVDTSSLSHRFMGRHWPHYKLEHVTYFNPTNLSMLCQRAGLEIVVQWPARKALGIGYAFNVVAAEGTPFLRRLSRLGNRLTPQMIKKIYATVPCGQFSMLVRRPR